jgi:dTDP-4-dehydrorhamnose 3,5-epimerase-like enzyme
MPAPVKYSAAARPAIDGVKVKPVRAAADERGWLAEILRADEQDLFASYA